MGEAGISVDQLLNGEGKMNIFTSWKTSLAGIGAIAIPLINQVLPVLPPQWATVATGVVAGLGLIFAKDSNVTGGTIKQ